MDGQRALRSEGLTKPLPYAFCAPSCAGAQKETEGETLLADTE